MYMVARDTAEAHAERQVDIPGQAPRHGPLDGLHLLSALLIQEDGCQPADERQGGKGEERPVPRRCLAPDGLEVEDEHLVPHALRLYTEYGKVEARCQRNERQHEKDGLLTLPHGYASSWL